MAKKAEVAEPRGAKSKAVREYLDQHGSASVKEVAAALREQGVEVSEALVSKLKYGRGKTGKRKVGKRAKSAAATANGQDGELSKAEEIRRTYRGLGSNVRSRDIIAALAARSITVSSAQVSSTLKAMGLRKKGRKPGRPAGSATAAAPRQASNSKAGGSLSAADLIEAKKAVDSLGGVSQLLKALDVLAQLK